MSAFDGQTITVPCSKCGQKHQKSIRWLKANDHFVCLCGTRINLDRSQFLGKIREVERALDSIPRNITIKF